MILLFNPPAKEQLLKIRSALLPLHIRIQLIKPEQYNQPLGYLADMKDISPVEENYAGTANGMLLTASTRFVANMKRSILKTLFSNQSGRLPILL